MIEKLKYLFTGFIMLAVAGGFAACNDDKTTSDEWTSNYVYLERPSLGISTLEFNISQSMLGLVGDMEVKLPLEVRLLKPWKSDVAVTFSYTITGDLPDGIVTFGKGGTVVIPAGEVAVGDIMELNTDWSFVPQTAVTYSVTVSIESVQPVSGRLRISTKQKSLAVTVNKAKLMDMVAGQLPTGVKMDRSPWTVYIAKDKGSNPTWTPTIKLSDDKTNTYEQYLGNAYLGVKIDMGSTQTITGLETRARSANYPIRSCAIYSSVDDVEWILKTPEEELPMATAVTQYISFIVPVTARYIVIGMNAGVGNNTSNAETYLYAAE